MYIGLNSIGVRCMEIGGRKVAKGTVCRVLKECLALENSSARKGPMGLDATAYLGT